jgi:hydroxyacylglutathione hydrolase
LLIDPSEGEPIHLALQNLSAGDSALKLDAILCTHHHWDHVGGLSAVRERAPTCSVYAHERDRDRIDHVTHGLTHNDSFAVGGLRVRALHVPAHTEGAMAYVINDAMVFTGDTLFTAGCGRLFEGTASMMTQALHETLGSLPGETLVYPGHEYTEKNLRFALSLTPDHPPTRARAEQVEALRARGLPSVPSQMALEWKTNPFLRAGESALQAVARANEPGVDINDVAAVFAVLRALRDRY